MRVTLMAFVLDLNFALGGIQRERMKKISPASASRRSS
jgi:hypothetical protein